MIWNLPAVRIPDIELGPDEDLFDVTKALYALAVLPGIIQCGK
jgi:hypothetical protein